MRTKRIFVICGTPGVGKTTISNKLISSIPSLKYINVSDFAISENLTLEFDENLDSHILDHPRLIKVLHTTVDNYDADILIETHTIENLLEDFDIDKFFVIRASLNILNERLKQRGYKKEKIKNNLDCETFEIVECDVRDIFDENKIVSFVNDNKQNLEDITKEILTNIN